MIIDYQKQLHYLITTKKTSAGTDSVDPDGAIIQWSTCFPP